MKLRAGHLLILVVGFMLSASCLAQIPERTLAVAGLKEKVVVLRDSRSVPYIRAQSLEDMYFAQGYETANDRLWQMDLMRRAASGRLAELFGKTVIDEDKRWRKFGFSRSVRESVKRMSPELRVALENYARGVNAYIESLDPKKLPSEFRILQYAPEKWKPEDSLIIGKILADGLSTTWWLDVNQMALKKLSQRKYKLLTNPVTARDVVNFGKDTGSKAKSAANLIYTPEFSDRNIDHIEIETAKSLREKSLSRVGLYARDLAASNNWVVSGKRTFDGKAMLANDPHLRATAPGIWYLTHLSGPGIKVAGVSIPGVPGVILGHNEHIAWGATNVGPDVQDVYFEEFNEKGEYKTPDGWKKPVIHTEVIKFRPSLLSPKLETTEIDVLETRNGPVFRKIGGKQTALKWTALDPDNQEFEAFIALNSAENWDDFRNALKKYGGATQNFVYADTEGNIGWQVAGAIPIRKKGDGSFPYSGAASDGDWIGFIPFDDLPRLYNPESGFIVTANQRIVGTDYKYPQLVRGVAGPWRARRIHELLLANPKLTMDAMRDIQHDVFNIPLSEFAREIVRRNAATPETLKLLRGWDGKMTADSSAATVAEAINSCVGNAAASENRPASGWHFRQFILPFDIPEDNKFWLPRDHQSWDSLMKECETKALASLKKLGADRSDWLWGKANPTQFSHPLAAAPLIGSSFKVEYFDVNGSGQTPNVGENVSMRLIAKPSDWDKTRHVIPLGQSGNNNSKHWNDQFESWKTGKPAELPFSDAAVKAAARERIVLEPAAQ